MVDDFGEATKDPNRVRAILDLEARLAAAGRTDLGFRLLVHVLTDASTNAAAKTAYAGAMILEHLLPWAKDFGPSHLGVEEGAPLTKAVARGLGRHLVEAKSEHLLLQRLKRGEFNVRNSPHYIMAPPKSGSSMLSMLTANMIRCSRGTPLDRSEPYHYQGYPGWWDMGIEKDWDLRPNIACDPHFVRHPGGIYKGHIEPSDKNLAVLGLYPESRYVVLTRDPRDLLAGQLCNGLRTAKNKRVLAPGEVHAALDQTISGGRLLQSLTFMAGWLGLRDSSRSIVVRYEDLLETPVEVMTRVSDLLELGLSREQLGEIHETFATVTDRPERGDAPQEFYPMGWTGAVGAWRRYFSDENRRAFDRVWSGFQMVTTHAQRLHSLYPQLDR